MALSFSTVDIRRQQGFGVAMQMMVKPERSIDRGGARFPEQSLASGSANKPAGAARERILVVDDEEDLLELVNYNLSKEGFRVRPVTSGEEALAEARKTLPDLIVLDLLLPAVDGLEVCRRLKSDPRTRHIPVIMLTAKSEESDMVAGLELGADDYVTKPFSPRVLLARVKAILRRKAKGNSDEEGAIRCRDLVIHPG